MKNESEIKQVSNIEYVGPCQIQTASIVSINFSAVIKKLDEKEPEIEPSISEILKEKFLI